MKKFLGIALVVLTFFAFATILAIGGNIIVQNGQINASTGISLGGKLLSNSAGTLSWEGNKINSGENFTNLIAAFPGTCPSGWTEYTAAKGKVIVGINTSKTQFDNIGEVGGEIQHTLTIAEMPSHTHTVSSKPAGIYYESDAFGGVDPSSNFGTLTVPATGSGNAHNILQPYIVLRYCQKNQGADFAEWIPTKDSILIPGTIVSIDTENFNMITKTKSEYDSKAIGIITTQPGWIIGNENKDSAQMALSGRVPAIVLVKENEIAQGDFIASSNISGIGMKAIKIGKAIGQALESTENWNSETCVHIQNIDEINWPIDNGNNDLHPCYYLPDGTIVGKIMVLVENIWYSPQTEIAELKEKMEKLSEQNQDLIMEFKILKEDNAKFKQELCEKNGLTC
jgi:FtsZ-binding cell division protein ZapB